MKIQSKQFFTALVLIVGIPTMAQANLLRVSATGTVINIFGDANPALVPFSTGDAFSYSIIVSDNPALDTNPLPEDTVQNYSPNFQANVAGAATLSFGSYMIPATQVSNSFLGLFNDSFGDSIEISSQVSGAALIDGIAPSSFSIKMTDFSGTTLSSSAVTPAAFQSSGFTDRFVFLNMDSNRGSCVGRRCAVGTIDNITVETVASTPLPAAAWLFGSGLFGLVALGRRK